MPEQRLSGPAAIFYAYAREDEVLREQVEQHLALLQRQGLLLPWHDRQIEAGEDWKHAIDDHLEAASIILLLISPAFLASDYCYEVEMRRALERQRAGEARVIPLLLRPCDWQSAPFGDLQALPRDGRAITTWANQDEAFLQVSLSLRMFLTQSSPPVTTGRSAAQSRANMLVKLQRMYDEVLDDSLQKLAWIDLPLSAVPDAVHTSANFLLRRARQPAQFLAPGTTIQQVYQQANQELLILGDPGAGKSTLLSQLGRHLLLQTQQAQQPLPVVFPLSSWSQKRLPLDLWIIEQLCSPLYEVPRWQSQQWVHNQQILPLLDGLDEVEEAARPACIAAINVYHREYITPLVVCSRSQEYLGASQHQRLHLHNAVEVQPLTAMQQEEMLQQIGSAAEGLRAELATNQELRDLTRTPLWLNVLLVTGKEAPLPLPSLPQEHGALQQEMLRRYIERMCERKGDATRYPLKQTQHWLGFLANQMRQRNQVLFAFEELQPDWLPRRSRRVYHWSVGLIVGLVGMLVFGLVGMLVFGLVLGLESKVRLAEHLIWSWKRILSMVGIMLIVGLVNLPFGMLPLGLPLGLIVVLVSKKVGGLVCGLLAGLVHGWLVGGLVGLLGPHAGRRAR
jgi:hypothetical protein